MRWDAEFAGMENAVVGSLSAPDCMAGKCLSGNIRISNVWKAEFVVMLCELESSPKFVTTLESLYQRCVPQRLPEDMERRDGLRPGENDDDDV